MSRTCRYEWPRSLLAHRSESCRHPVPRRVVELRHERRASVAPPIALTSRLACWLRAAPNARQARRPFAIVLLAVFEVVGAIQIQGNSQVSDIGEVGIVLRLGERYAVRAEIAGPQLASSWSITKTRPEIVPIRTASIISSDVSSSFTNNPRPIAQRTNQPMCVAPFSAERSSGKLSAP
jgi:hypothetical protein